MTDGPDDLWHYDSPEDATKAGVTKPCSCKGFRRAKYPTKRHKVGRRWRVRWYVGDRRSSRSFLDNEFGQADDFYKEVHGELQKGIAPFDRSRGNIMLIDYGLGLIAGRYTDPNSRRTVMSRFNCHIVPYFTGKNMIEGGEIQPSTIVAWLAWMRTKPSKRGGLLSENTVELAWVLLMLIFKTAVEVDRIRTTNPMAGVVRPTRSRHKVIDTWEPDTCTALIGHVAERHRRSAGLAYKAGLRQGEVLGYAVGDVNPLRQRFTVRHQVARDEAGKLILKPPKGGKVRTVPLSKDDCNGLLEDAKRYGTIAMPCICCPGRVNHVVVFTASGGLYNRDTWNTEVWHPAVRAAGMAGSGDTGLHQLRHAFVATLIDGGADPTKVQAFCGHESITMTMDIYSHLFKRGYDDVINIMAQAHGTGGDTDQLTERERRAVVRELQALLALPAGQRVRAMRDRLAKLAS